MNACTLPSDCAPQLLQWQKGVMLLPIVVVVVTVTFAFGLQPDLSQDNLVVSKAGLMNRYISCSAHM